MGLSGSHNTFPEKNVFFIWNERGGIDFLDRTSFFRSYLPLWDSKKYVEFSSDDNNRFLLSLQGNFSDQSHAWYTLFISIRVGVIPFTREHLRYPS